MIARRTILATVMLVLAAGVAQATCPSAPAGYKGAGKESFASLEKYMLEKGEAAPNTSGRQELLENIINTYL